jgi:hypothetical protein
MSLSAPKTVYGVHSLTLYNQTTFEPYGIMKVLGNLSFAFNGQFKDLMGGSSRFAWDSEAGVLDATLTGRIKQIENFAFERFLGAAVTANTAEASGSVGTLTNKKGTSVMNAATGIDSVAAISGSTADLKTGLYVVKVATSSTVDVYCMTDVDFSKGTPKEFNGDDLKIVASAVTITTAGVETNITGFGFKFIGGSGTIGMTVGDTAYFYVRKVNAGSDIITIGQSTQQFSEFGAIITAQQKSNGDLFEVELPRVKGIGLPITMSEQAWLETDVTMKALYDSATNRVATIRRLKAA